MIVTFMGNLYITWSFMKWILTFRAPRGLYVLLAVVVTSGFGAGLLLGHMLWA